MHIAPLGLKKLRDPLQISLGPQGTQLPCVATWRLCKSLDVGEAVYWQEEAYGDAPLFTSRLASGGS